MNININRLNFSYKKNVEVLKHIDLSVKGGEILALLGSNGSGKTSLINLIAGLLAPDSGNCEVGAYLSVNHEPSVLADTFHLNEEGLLSTISTSYSMKASTFCRANEVFYPRFDRNLYQRICHDLKVDDSHWIQNMSMGYRKKFFMAFGLATDSRLLLLDEPLNGLDISAKKILRQYISSVATQKDGVVIISTHQVREMNGWVNAVAVLDKNQIVFHQSVAAIEQQVVVNITKKDAIPDDSIYSMPLLNDSVSVLQPRTTADQAILIDYEMIFHAAINCPDKLNKVFNLHA